MMKSTEFITHNLTNTEKQIILEYNIPEQIISTLQQIKHNCKPYLIQNPSPIASSPLFRGLRTHKTSVTGQVRLDNRKPMSSPQHIHVKMNDIFKEKYGSEFRNAMFCTGRYSMASAYGTVYYIFPEQDFKFLWSPKVYDLYRLYSKYREKLPIQHFIEDNMSILSSYKTTDLVSAIKSENEIMIRAKSYVGLNADFISTEASPDTFKGIEEFLHNDK